MNAYDQYGMTECPLFDQPQEDTYQPANPSAAAKESIRDRLPELRAKVLDFIRSCGERGCTDEEAQDGIPMEPNTQRPRRYELVEMRLVTDSGRRRMLKSGKSGTVWIAWGNKA